MPWTRFHLETAARAWLTRRSSAGSRKPRHLFLALTDHFEPQVGRVDRGTARARVEEWLRGYPAVARKFRDAEGRHPPHGFFYPWDEYDEWEMARLVELCRDGWGELELHLHHADDTSDSLRAILTGAVEEYRRAGALTSWSDERPAFAFIHGNWALDNSRIEAGRNYCGVNDEISLLQSAGCYADFTFPAWEHTSQPRMVNRIFYAADDPALPKSHDWGDEARAGRTPPGGLLLIPGPLVPFRRGRRPAMDDGDLSGSRRYAPARLDRWVRCGIQVRDRPDWVFVKLHCHGAADGSRTLLLEEDLPALFADAANRYNDGAEWVLHHVTAREMYNLVKAAESGRDPGVEAARDFVLPPPHPRP